jgi:hypothetical protein
MTARLVGLLAGAVMSVFGIAVVFNVKGAAQALIEQQRRQPYVRFVPWATSEVFLRMWAALVALIGVAVIALELLAQVSGT